MNRQITRKRLFRKEAGNMLVEAVIAVLVSSIFASALVQSMSQGLSLSSGSQNQMLCSAICTEVIEAARSMPYVTLRAYAAGNTGNLVPPATAASTTYPLILNMNPGDTALTNSPFPRPLLQDRINFGYGQSSHGSKAIQNSFNSATCRVEETITANINNTVTVTVKIVWSDSSGPHTFSQMTLVSPNGING